MNFAAIDFETTGYINGEKNEPWQLGVALVSDGKIVSTHEWFFGTSLTPDAEPFMEQWEQFYPLIGNTALVAHNIACEKTILTRMAPLTKWGPWFDTMKIAKKRYPGLGDYSLGALCTALDCVPDFQGRSWHDGLFDAIACALLAFRLGIK